MQLPLTALLHFQSILHKRGSFTLIENTLGTQEEGKRLYDKLRADLANAPNVTQKFFAHVTFGWTCEGYHLILINSREE